MTSKTVGGTTSAYANLRAHSAEAASALRRHSFEASATAKAGSSSLRSMSGYDANGNLTKADDTTNTWTYDYDWNDRLTSYDAPGSSDDTTYGYDSLGWRRVNKSVNGTLTKYLPDVAAPGMDVLGEYDSSNELIRSYVTPGIDENISVYDGADTYYYMRDGLGSVRAVYDASEALQNSYHYEAFGQALSVSENVTQPYRFTGRSWDGSIGLYFYRSRYYNPSLGVFTQKDRMFVRQIFAFERTLPEAFSALFPLYIYSNNNPVTHKDPFGLFTIPRWLLPWPPMPDWWREPYPYPLPLPDFPEQWYTRMPLIPDYLPNLSGVCNLKECQARVHHWHDQWRRKCHVIVLRDSPVIVGFPTFCFETCMGVHPVGTRLWWGGLFKGGPGWSLENAQWLYAGGITSITYNMLSLCLKMFPIEGPDEES